MDTSEEKFIGREQTKGDNKPVAKLLALYHRIVSDWEHEHGAGSADIPLDAESELNIGPNIGSDNMYVIIIDQHNGTWCATCRISDNMFDNNVLPVFGYGISPDSAIDRLLSDYPQIESYRLISRPTYDLLWNLH